ncbi:hypothetical protein O7599_12735 [Streptomyces sp. WMMC500]|uniref:hypothetical protein n=1 Tax=Streptomyces sp. WMMC500 TaxID=3015154 RepID=UPI00248C2B9B|nr:hypothetical protein [Streptomyces sp. WMMC500]WBB63336.1 hypothetical protein O7599_12735 [Streptomyces sp. WMMC500]
MPENRHIGRRALLAGAAAGGLAAVAPQTPASARARRPARPGRAGPRVVARPLANPDGSLPMTLLWYVHASGRAVGRALGPGGEEVQAAWQGSRVRRPRALHASGSYTLQGVNARGALVGYHYLPDENRTQAVVWSRGGAPRRVLPGDDYRAWGTHIDDRGRVLVQTQTEFQADPELPSRGGLYVLRPAGSAAPVRITPPDPEAVNAAPDALGNAGHVVAGQVRFMAWSRDPFHWHDGTVTELSRLTGAYRPVFGAGVNDRGVVAGSAEGDTGEWRAFVWDGDRLTDFSRFDGGASSVPLDGRFINARGEVVGRSNATDGPFHWSPADGLTALPTLPEALYGTEVTALNDRGDAAGHCYTEEGQRAVYWRGGRVVDLGLPAGAVESEASWLTHTGEAWGTASFPDPSGGTVTRCYRWTVH